MKKHNETITEKTQISPNKADSILLQQYSFENLVVGEHNKFAFAAAKAVVDSPGMNCNPLFIYGSSGVGKTHLLQAIGNEMLNKDPSTRIYYTTADNYTNELLYVLKSDDVEHMKQFRKKYRDIDVLLVEDIQFFSYKNCSQESFFHLFVDLYNAGKQIIISSDRAVKELNTIEERLCSRFAGGIIAKIQAPPFESRVEILQKKARQYDIQATPNVLKYIADHEKENIIKLEGILKSVGLYAKINNISLDNIDVAKEALHQLGF